MPPRTRSALKASKTTENDAFVYVEPKPASSKRPARAKVASPTRAAIPEDPEPKLVLRDITDQFLASAAALPSPAYNPWRSKRKPKLPTKSAARPNIPSSLPPSSPPPPTSSYAPNFDAEAYFLAPATQDEPSKDDPFGFFAVEKKLKVRRAEGETRRVLATEMQPEARTDEREEFDPAEARHSTPNPLLTPRKQRIRKRKSAASPSLSSTALYTPNSSSVPSSPSPAKPLSGRLPVVAQHSRVTVYSSPGKAKKGREKKKAKADPDETVDPRELARHLEALLPRRPMRRSGRNGGKGDTRGKGKRSKVETGDESEGEDGKMARKVPGRSAKGALKGKGKAKANAKGEEFNLNDDQREKWERERQERLEYFKKLEEYSFEKENVYVI